jgi:hypothetical protein
MKTTFEPGDGSFEITLAPGEILPSQWNLKGVVVVREIKNNGVRLVKKCWEVLAVTDPALRRSPGD